MDASPTIRSIHGRSAEHGFRARGRAAGLLRESEERCVYGMFFCYFATIVDNFQFILSFKFSVDLVFFNKVLGSYPNIFSVLSFYGNIDVFSSNVFLGSREYM
jgi:hypothetical protein